MLLDDHIDSVHRDTVETEDLANQQSQQSTVKGSSHRYYSPIHKQFNGHVTNIRKILVYNITKNTAILRFSYFNIDWESDGV